MIIQSLLIILVILVIANLFIWIFNYLMPCELHKKSKEDLTGLHTIPDSKKIVKKEERNYMEEFKENLINFDDSSDTKNSNANVSKKAEDTIIEILQPRKTETPVKSNYMEGVVAKNIDKPKRERNMNTIGSVERDGYT